MNEQLNRNSRRWLENLAAVWHLSVEQTAYLVGDEEIANRVENYPKVAAALTTSPFDIQQFAKATRKCWVMAGRYDGMHFNEFVREESRAANTIQQLHENFPQERQKAAKRIEAFIESAVELGFRKPKGSSDWAGAAQLASLILTTLYPSRFVDYRRERWKRFADKFGCEQLPSVATHSEWLIWAGEFASAISESQTYQEFWPLDIGRLSQPLWVISGICWSGVAPGKPQSGPFDPTKLSFPEGAAKRRLHLIRERNRTLVGMAKSIGLEKDPKLRCQVCNFSFLERYGKHGRGFIEAHHKQPVAELKSECRSRLEDIALVCANCHRMLHSGDNTLTIEELKSLLQN
jgi:hypothetical protein